MRRPSIGFHPSFDALSAHADRADTDAARSRVGRHVAQCAVCRGTVDEIRALGGAARANEVPGAPAELWARIERGLDAEASGSAARDASVERAVPLTVATDVEPKPGTAGEKRPVSKAVRRTTLGLMLVVAATAAVMAMDAREPLAAATPRRLTTDREFARPGSAIVVHYRPIARLANERTLAVWMAVPGRRETLFDQALERAGTLQRVSALDYMGIVVMPDSTPLAAFVVGDSAGEILDRTEARAGRLPAVVLAADSRGQPRLDALYAALITGRRAPDSATMFRWAKQMRELYPSEPETWILSDVYTRRGVIGDIVKFFESRERKYYGWHDRLERRAKVSPDAEMMMANLGWELMDTTRADFWTSRLMRDYPTSPWLPGLWIRRYRDVPTDSVAGVLREFEPIFVKAGEPRDVLTRAIALADRSGDSTLARHWHRRLDPREVSWVLSTELSRMAGDRTALADVRRRLLAALAEADSAEHGGPTLWGRSRRFASYQRQRVLTRLAAVQLIEGDARGAKTALDRIIGASEAESGCPMAEAMRWRAEASRRLGLMDAARADLAYVVVTGDWRVQVLADSAPAWLGSGYTEISWNSALDAANAFKQKCWAASRDARRRAGG